MKEIKKTDRLNGVKYALPEVDRLREAMKRLGDFMKTYKQ